MGTGLCPSESPNAREGGRADPSALDFALNSQPGFSCELDPSPVISIHRLNGCSDSFTLAMCRERVPVDGLTTDRLLASHDPCGMGFVPAGGLSSATKK